MGRKNKGAEPYPTQTSRRNVRQVQTVTGQEMQEPGAAVSGVQQDDQSMGIPEPTAVNNNVTQVLLDSDNRNLIVEDGQVPSTSNQISDNCINVNDTTSSTAPTMEQFMVLQASLIEMKSLMNEIKKSQPVGSQDHTLKGTNVNRVDTGVKDSNTANANILPIDLSQGSVMQTQTQPGQTGSVIENVAPVLPNFPNLTIPVQTSDNNQTADLGTVNATITQAVNNQVQNLITQGDYLTHSEGNFDGISRVIDLKVSDKIKNQIWSNQYVNLAVLIDHKSDVVDGYKLVTGEGDQLCVTQNKITKRLTSLSQWCDAFLVYLTVYSRKYPNSVPNLTTYMSNVKMLHQKGGDFIFYDEEFRFMRQRNPSIGWSIDSNLWLECRDVRGNSGKNQGRRYNNSFRAPSSNNNRSAHPTGFCYKYHSQGRCPNYAQCNYKHLCYSPGCNAKHPIFQCPKRIPATNSGQNKTSQAKPGNNSN